MTRLWRGLKFILIDWTVTPGMMSLNKQHPFVYQLVTASVVTLLFGLLVAVAIVVISLLGLWAVALTGLRPLSTHSGH